MITIEHLQEEWPEQEWNEKTHYGKYRVNQLEQHQEIMNRIFDLVVEYKDTENPLSNFLILLNNDKSFYRPRRFAGRMADLSDNEIGELREEFFIYHDNSGHIRAEFVPEPGKSWGTLKPGTSKSAFYIVQGTHPNRFSRHDIVHWYYPRDIETPICSTKEEFNAMERELYINGFGDYEVWGAKSDNPRSVYRLYDMSDEEFTARDKVRFIRIFEHISDDNIPDLFLHEDKEGVRELAVDNGFSFGRGVLGHTRSSGAEPDINKVPQDIVDKYLKIVDRIAVVKYPGETMTVGDGETISMEKRGEFVFIEGIADKQKASLRKTVDYYLRDTSYCPYDDEQLDILSKFLSLPTKDEEDERDEKRKKIEAENQLFRGLMNMITKNPPKFDEEYETFMSDLMKQPDSKKRRYIKSRTEQKIYHDFESSLLGPKLALIEDLKAAGYDDMMVRAMEGDYDF